MHTQSDWQTDGRTDKRTDGRSFHAVALMLLPSILMSQSTDGIERYYTNFNNDLILIRMPDCGSTGSSAQSTLLMEA